MVEVNSRSTCERGLPESCCTLLLALHLPAVRLGGSVDAKLSAEQLQLLMLQGFQPSTSNGGPGFTDMATMNRPFTASTTTTMSAM